MGELELINLDFQDLSEQKGCQRGQTRLYEAELLKTNKGRPTGIKRSSRNSTVPSPCPKDRQKCPDLKRCLPCLHMGLAPSPRNESGVQGGEHQGDEQLPIPAVSFRVVPDEQTVLHHDGD